MDYIIFLYKNEEDIDLVYICSIIVDKYLLYKKVHFGYGSGIYIKYIYIAKFG